MGRPETVSVDPTSMAEEWAESRVVHEVGVLANATVEKEEDRPRKTFRFGAWTERWQNPLEEGIHWIQRQRAWLWIRRVWGTSGPPEEEAEGRGSQLCTWLQTQGFRREILTSNTENLETTPQERTQGWEKTEERPWEP